MNGAESLQRTLLNCGVDTCFMNPGTSEMHFVAALDAVPGMRSILALFEGVATGAADGYARIARKPAATLLHLGPGLANGMANLHNARKAGTPIVNVVGDHATYHHKFDAPLTSDIEGMAAPVSKWVHTSPSADAIAADTAQAVAAATALRPGVATLILPADTAWNDSPGPAEPIAPPAPNPVDEQKIAAAAKALRADGRRILSIGGAALISPGLQLAARIAAATGAEIYCDTIISRIERGAGRVRIRRFPYFPEAVEQEIEGTRQLVLAGTRAPVAFFAYPGRPSTLTPAGVDPISIATPDEDPLAALEALAAALDAPPFDAVAKKSCVELELPALPTGELTVKSVGRTIAALLPEHTVVCDDAVTSGALPFLFSENSRPHDWLRVTGGSIGIGMPLAVGTAVARPDAKTLCLSGDGSAMYTIQSLWTQARHQLNVTNVVFSNRSYAILATEYERLRDTKPGPRAHDMLDLTRPEMDFVHMAQGMGVEAFRSTTAEEFNTHFAHCMSHPGPHLIDVILPRP